MIIQSINQSSGAPPVGYVSNGVPGVVANPSNAEPALSQPSPQQLNSAVAGINQAMQQSNSSLEFSVNSSTNEPIVTVVDTDTGEVIHQIPSKTAIAIAQSIEQFQQRQGLLMNQKA